MKRKEKGKKIVEEISQDEREKIREEERRKRERDREREEKEAERSGNVHCPRRQERKSK